MKIKTNIYNIAILLITLLLIISNCSNQAEIKVSNKGSLNLNIIANDQNRTLQPDTDMNIASYDITGTGPEESNFAMSNITGNNVAINNLETGAWTIIVFAKNASGTTIASGSAAIVVNAYTSTSAAVSVSPLNGQGTLNLILNWDTALSNPGVTCTLTPIGQAPVSINFTITGNSASYMDSSLQPGYYTVSMQLKDDSTVIWGVVEAVQILATESTIGNYNIMTPPVAPSWITASDGTSGVKVDLEWENSPGVSKYYIYRSTSAEGDYTGIGSSSTNNFRDTSVDEFVNYYYKVKAYKPTGYYSSFSSYDIGYRRETRYTYSNYLSFNTADLYPEIRVNDLCVFDNKIFSAHWDQGHVYKYDGWDWNYAADNRPTTSYSPSVSDLAVYNSGPGSSLYAAGSSGAYGGRGAVYVYDKGDNLWKIIYGIPNFIAGGLTPFSINYLSPFNGKLYVAASAGNGFDAAIYEYTSGTSWSTSIQSTNNSFRRMQVYNDGSSEKLYAVKYHSSPVKSEIYSFDGSTWSGPLASFSGSIDGFCVYNGRLFLSYNKIIYTFNGTTWSQAKSFSYDTGAFAVWNNKLYVSVGKMIYVHEGTDPTSNWAMDTDFTSINPLGIQALCVYNNQLYIGMRFSNYRSGMTYETSAKIYTIGMLAW